MHVTACRNNDIRVVLAQAKVALLDILGGAGGWDASEFHASYEAWTCALFSLIDWAALCL